METNYEILEAVVAYVGGGRSPDGDAEVAAYLASSRPGALAGVVAVAGPDPAKRAKLAASQPLLLRGVETALQPRTARLVAALSDELAVDEEDCLELFARVTDRARRRELADRLGLGAPAALDDDVAGAARRLWYFEAQCGLRALGECVKGSLDARLPSAKRRALFGCVAALVRGGLAGTLLDGVATLAGPAWARPHDRARWAGGLAALAAEAFFFAFYEIQLEAEEAARLLEVVRDLSRLLDGAAAGPRARAPQN